MNTKFTKKEIIIGIIVPLIMFILGVFGSYIINNIVPDSENKIISINKINGKNQNKIKQLPHVASFLDYLKCIENKDVVRIWDYLTEGQKREFTNKQTILYSYYLTNKYEIIYIMPKDETSFFVFLKFEDCVTDLEINNLKMAHNTIINKVVKEDDTIIDGLVKEMYVFLDNRFIINNEIEVKNNIQNYIRNMTVKNFVANDWRFPMWIAKGMNLEPKEYYVDEINNLQYHYIVSEVVMCKENDIWKVDKFKTIAISRWN